MIREGDKISELKITQWILFIAFELFLIAGIILTGSINVVPYLIH